jgi:hypothetical protein
VSVATGYVSWFRFDLPSDNKVGTDSGVGTDVGTRTTGSGSSKSSTDVSVGVDTANVFTGGNQTKVGHDYVFGFSRKSAAGLMWLFRDFERPALVVKSAQTVTDSGVSTQTAFVQFQDRTVAVSESGIGVDKSTKTVGTQTLNRSDSGVGSDSAFAISPQEVLPEAVLEVAFASNPTDETQVYTVVSSDSASRQLEFAIKRGRQDELKQPETGTMITALFNQSRRFDPSYTLSPYYPNILPVKQARLSAVRGSVQTFLFVGDIEQWPQQSNERMNQAIIQANDGFDALAQIDVTVTRPQETTGARINAILDAALWPVSKRVIDTGKTVLHANTYEGNALELIRRFTADEDGYFFMRGDGFARFIERHARFKPPYTTPYLTLSSRPTGTKLPLTDADYQVDKDFIKNQVTVKVEAIIDVDGNTVQEEQEFTELDATSQTKFRPRSLTFDQSAIDNLNEAVVKAQYHLDRLKDPVVRVKKVVIEPQQHPNLWAHCLQREIGDRVGVEIYPVQTGTEEAVLFQGIIEYIEHRYVVGRWQTTWFLSPADMNNYWILEDTTFGVLGSTTRLGY